MRFDLVIFYYTWKQKNIFKKVTAWERQGGFNLSRIRRQGKGKSEIHFRCTGDWHKNQIKQSLITDW